MKINIKNTKKISAALAPYNGSATAHTFCAGQIENIGYKIIRHLRQWFTLAEMRGITGNARSGEQLPRGYKHTRKITDISWTIGSAGNVFLTSVSCSDAWIDRGLITFQFSEADHSTIASKAIKSATSI
tara:strand:- start:137 stop:523 length:387 start_codon:yes stop_codon:yes gene_type:complete